MCGPIAIALPVPESSNLSFFFGRILYNLGRVVSYSLLGALFGFVGQRIALAGAQQIVSIALGVIIIIAVLMPQKQKNFFIQLPIVQKVIQPLKTNIGLLFKKGTFCSMFTIGILNGFLPCGFVYIGLAGAIASGSAITGAAVMFLFGLGTIPAMLTATVFGKYINIGIRTKLRKATPYLAMILAVLFILRGMNLGIHYISPKISTQSELSNGAHSH
jgi:sulfite exporter TauE/SafE